MDDLTIEDQKLLTEKGLGECWHEYKGATATHYGKCVKCGLTEGYAALPEFARLDFSDWRVVGRLVEKIYKQNLLVVIGTNGCSIRDFSSAIVANSPFLADQPQLAICRAVVAYLKENKR